MAITANDNQEWGELGYEHKAELLQLLITSCYEGKGFMKFRLMIELANSLDDYEKIKSNLLANQIGFDSAVNPGQKEINAHLRRLVKHPNK